MRALWAALSVSALWISAAACSCDGDDLEPIPTVDGGQRRCVKDEDCGAREKCFVGACLPRDQCEPNVRPCPEQNQVCRDSNGDTFFECVFERCERNEECAGKIQCSGDQMPACSAGGCICGEPCNGGCPTGQGCCVSSNACLDLPEQCRGLTCPLGQFVSVTSSGSWSTRECMITGESCRCERLPPLALGDVGLHSALAHDGTDLVLSAYNLDYGDLMFGRVMPDLRTIRWEFVDGVPSSTIAITGDVDGPRGGNSDPGADLGLYTDLAVDPSGRAHVAYHDRDRGALKYAIRSRSGWQTHTIQSPGGSGVTGLYSSVVLDVAGRPRVAYLTVREESAPGGDRKSTLRVAVSSTTTPRGPTDWVIRDIESVSLAGLPCTDRCNVGEVCRAADRRCVRPDAPNACNPACMGDNRCIGGSCVAIDPLPPYRDLPTAAGLWPSIQIGPDGGLLIAYYDRLSGRPKVGRIAGDAATGRIDVVEVGTFGQTEDAGLYPSLFVTGAGAVHLAYMHASRRSVVYRELDPVDLSTRVSEEIEVGIGVGSGPDGQLVGADIALVVDAQGVARVAYQNATLADLRYGKRMGAATWSVSTLRGDETPYRGSFGFYTDQILDPTGSGAIVSTYRFNLSAPMGPANGLEIVSAP